MFSECIVTELLNVYLSMFSAVTVVLVYESSEQKKSDRACYQSTLPAKCSCIGICCGQLFQLRNNNDYKDLVLLF